MVLRLAVLGDIHGNEAALDAALSDIGRHRPDRIAITGDLLLHGPRPAEVLRRVRELDGDGAIVIQGNTDVAVADFDYAAAFPWLQEVPASQRAAAEWAHEQLSDDDLLYLRRLPAERRLWADDTLVLVCHGSPGSQTSGLPADLDPAVTVERVTRTDARVIVCGHTHVADVRELGRRMICNPGSCGYAFDGEPAACWALITLADGSEPTAELFRPVYDAQQVADDISQRGLVGDVYRAATVRTGRFVR
ncbi:MAG TPA: metallophosphoesterase family protein [Candidatus Caenarcaniphilales bacterium]|nr:metallophosphoesterase family protein [Candidatus Caenarcaniphilales bacterium]